MSRKTVLAVVVSAVLVVGTGVVAATTILDMKVPGFATESASDVTPAPEPAPADTTGSTRAEAAPAPTRAPTAPAAPGSGRPAGSGGPTPVTAASAQSGGSAPAVLATPAPAPAPAFAPAPSPAPITAPITAPDEDDGDAPRADGAIPPVPAGCREPEWDREHGYWKCHVDEPEHEDD